MPKKFNAEWVDHANWSRALPGNYGRPKQPGQVAQAIKPEVIKTELVTQNFWRSQKSENSVWRNQMPRDTSTKFSQARDQLFGNMTGPITQTQKEFLRTGSEVWDGVERRNGAFQMNTKFCCLCQMHATWKSRKQGSRHRLKGYHLERNFKEQWNYWKWESWGKRKYHSLL